MQRVLSLYPRLMATHPVKVQILTTATIMLAGDLSAQIFIEKAERIDVARAARFFAIGILFVGPVVRTWYTLLETMLGTGGAGVAVVKMLLDQLLFSPVYTASFLVCLGVFQRRSWGNIARTVRNDFLPVLTVSYMIWPMAQVVNFNFVPLNYRMLFANSVGLFWSIYLAWRENAIPTPSVSAHAVPA